MKLDTGMIGAEHLVSACLLYFLRLINSLNVLDRKPVRDCILTVNTNNSYWMG